MPRQLTITVSDEVFDNLESLAANRTISDVIEELARPAAGPIDLESEYRAMSLDLNRERDAEQWAEGLVGDSLLTGGDAPR
jgi:predicted CopG family antitoxin